MDLTDFNSKRKEYLDTLYGVPLTSEQVSRRYVDLGRQLGKTTTMLQAMDFSQPNYYIIVVHKYSYGKELLDNICRTYGDHAKDHLKFLVADSKISHICQILDDPTIKGRNYTDIFIDNAVWDIIMFNQINRFDCAKDYYKYKTINKWVHDESF